MNYLIVYASRGNSAKKVAEVIRSDFQVKPEIICLNEKKITAERLKFDYLILICPTYGDEELETEMENFLIDSDWSLHVQKMFSVCELGLYRGYKETAQGAGLIIAKFLKAKGMILNQKIMSVDSIPLEDFSLITKWSKELL
jgi:flavodoxin